MATILVVDDEPGVREYLVKLLGYRGHRTLEASDGGQALELARADRPDLVISDVVMPVMDGYRLVKELREDAALAGTPVIFLTATYQEEQARALAQACGVSCILTKPCPPLVVLEAVEEVLGRPAGPVLPPPADFDRDHLRLLTDTLNRKVHELQQTTKLLQGLSRRLMEAQETERRHLARELHDQVGQNLTVLKINLHNAQRQAGGNAALARLLRDGMGLVEQTLQQVRTLSLDLRPPLLDVAGLAAALRWDLDRQAERTGLAIHFTAEPSDGRLPAELEIVCFRVVQEALTNVLRHAQARRLDVELRQTPSDVTLVIQDDGVGFDVQAGQERAARGTSLGLLGMQERVLLASGELEVTSAPSRGTRIRARFSLTGQGQQAPPRGDMP